MLYSLYPMWGILFSVWFAKLMWYVVVVIWLASLGWRQSTENQGSRVIRRLVWEVSWGYQEKEVRPAEAKRAVRGRRSFLS